jgi:hypothetical protein
MDPGEKWKIVMLRRQNPLEEILIVVGKFIFTGTWKLHVFLTSLI